MATSEVAESFQPPGVKLPPGWGPYCELKDSTVNVEHLSPRLVLAIGKLAHVHMLLFGVPLLVVSGNDGDHVKGGKHYRNKAVDVRSWDKDRAGQLMFGVVLSFLAVTFNLAVFDERARDAGPHWHVEEAD